MLQYWYLWNIEARLWYWYLWNIDASILVYMKYWCFNIDVYIKYWCFNIDPCEILMLQYWYQLNIDVRQLVVSGSTALVVVPFSPYLPPPTSPPADCPEVVFVFLFVFLFVVVNSICICGSFHFLLTAHQLTSWLFSSWSPNSTDL